MSDKQRPQAVVMITSMPGFDYPKGHLIDDPSVIARIYDSNLQRGVVPVHVAYASKHTVKPVEEATPEQSEQHAVPEPAH